MRFVMSILIFLLTWMVWFDNFSLGAWCYLILHGNYGTIWFAKDMITPDPSFAQVIPISECIMAYVFVLAPYSYIGYLMVSG